MGLNKQLMLVFREHEKTNQLEVAQVFSFQLFLFERSRVDKTAFWFTEKSQISVSKVQDIL